MPWITHSAIVSVVCGAWFMTFFEPRTTSTPVFTITSHAFPRTRRYRHNTFTCSPQFTASIAQRSVWNCNSQWKVLGVCAITWAADCIPFALLFCVSAGVKTTPPTWPPIEASAHLHSTTCRFTSRQRGALVHSAGSRGDHETFPGVARALRATCMHFRKAC